VYARVCERLRLYCVSQKKKIICMKKKRANGSRGVSDTVTCFSFAFKKQIGSRDLFLAKHNKMGPP
jgi:hypothetical protein